MAIDTAAKRQAALLEFWGTALLPDGTMDAHDRAALMGLYPVTVGEPLPPAAPESFIKVVSFARRADSVVSLARRAASVTLVRK